jgi:uncharacterized protein YndB with AHSA1/START domain
VPESAAQPVTVSRRIEAPAERLFAVVADPARHPTIDGSGMLRYLVSASSSPIARVGDQFTVAMHNDEMGDYQMTNHVVEFEPGRRIGWEPVLAKASRPEDEEGIGERAHVVWRFGFTPLGSTITEVTETYDCTRSPEWLRKAVRGGERWVASMTSTLAKLAELSA